MVLVREKENDGEDSLLKVVDIQKLPVNFHRAVCIHSSLQFIDLLMQSLMFTHGFSSTPVIASNANQRFSRTLDAFEKIRTELCAVFRSKHRKSLSEVAILIGTSPMRPSYTYQVPIEVCDADDSTDESCGETCASLNDNERRKINRDLFMLRQNSDSKVDEKLLRAKNNRMFIFVKGNDGMVSEFIEEEDPNFCSKALTQSKYTFTHHRCTCQGGINRLSSNSSGKWLRIVPFVVHPRD
ncbi:unnamed protein product [Caenorhabditis angaria]|uniref:Uncharacterized protein n=1 Tax=Caenorhabditis angaria TaxID=860376 RepID=A0A9P1MSS5_9PELO|nr:unnamed protein product [Caenorhabditis angaria]